MYYLPNGFGCGCDCGVCKSKLGFANIIRCRYSSLRRYCWYSCGFVYGCGDRNWWYVGAGGGVPRVADT